MFQDITTSDNYSSWQYYHHDDKRKLFTMQFNIMYPNPPLQCCLPSNIMYKSAINNIEWGRGWVLLLLFLISLLSSNEPGNTFFAQDVSTFLAFFGCYIEFVFFSQIADLANEDTPQLYAACGRGPRSSMRVLRHGLEVMKTTFQIILFQKNLCVEMWLEWRLVLRKICYFKSSRFPKWLYQSCQVIPMLFGQSRHILKVDLLIQ